MRAPPLSPRPGDASCGSGSVLAAAAPVAPPVGYGLRTMELQYWYIVLELLIALLSIGGNVLVCWAVAVNSTLQTATNYFLVSLAVADIAVGLLAIPFAITISVGLWTDFHCCLFLACFVLVLTQSSIFSLLAVAVDRYLAIKIPLSVCLRILPYSDKRKGLDSLKKWWSTWSPYEEPLTSGP